MKTVIFDLDGVLVTTDKYHFMAWKKIADMLDLDFDETINNRLRGVSRMESLDIILEQSHYALSADEKELLAEEKNEYYCTLLSAMSKADLSDEVRKTLDTLRGRDYMLVVGSSSKNAPLILSRIGLDNYFDAVSDGNNIKYSKPDPEVFIKAAEFVCAAAAECYVVEDSAAGIDAAKSANMTAITIGDAANNSKADYIIERFSGLLDILP
jgi:beta-phosphoglucomutase